MGFAVAHEGGTKDGQYRAYARLLSRQLLKRGVDLSKVPRVREDNSDDDWLYVWDNEAEASAFAADLKKETKDRRWIVRPTTTKPCLGPLRPLELSVTRLRDGCIFGLSPLVELAIQVKFPGSCRVRQVLIGTEPQDDLLANSERLRKLTKQVLPILTEVGLEQLAEFGSYRVIDAVDKTEFLPPTPLR